eukprot:4932615-Pyramimonas_sp.AAC.1
MPVPPTWGFDQIEEAGLRFAVTLSKGHAEKCKVRVLAQTRLGLQELLQVYDMRVPVPVSYTHLRAHETGAYL